MVPMFLVKKHLYRIAASLIVFVAILGGMIFFSRPETPPPLKAVEQDNALIASFYQNLPPLEFFQARDRQNLAFHCYEGQPGHGVVIAVHGSTGSSIAMHALAKTLQAQGQTVYTIDFRGHGDSGKSFWATLQEAPLFSKLRVVA